MGLFALLLLFQTADYTAQGIKALESNQLDSAAQLFAKAIEADPADYAAHFHLTLAFSLQNKDAQAIPEYQKTLELKPKLYQAELNLGILLIRQKRAQEALAVLEDAEIQKPREFKPQFYYAEALLNTGGADKAEGHYRSAIELDPKSAAAELGLARAQANQNRLPEAAESFQKAAAIDPKFKDALLELAADYEKEHQPEAAITIYQQFPSNPAAQERLGELLIEAKRFADAIPRLEQAVAESPTSANRLALATAYRMNKEPQKQLAQLEKAVASEAGSYDLHMIYGRALRDERQLVPAAAQQFLAAAKIKPDSKEAWNELASVLIVHEDYVQGLAALDKVKALGQEVPGNYYLRAISLDHLKQLKPALESYQQFLAADGGKNPDEEFKARQRARILEKELSKR
jgi:tetratricopeptide (TPR) repeat protein